MCLPLQHNSKSYKKLALDTNTRVKTQHKVFAERFVKQLLDIEEIAIDEYPQCIKLQMNFYKIAATVKDELIL